ncbi:MAG: curli-like amyloid fiber formation chaperone CsgH [Alphaproteobacteria bacterium]|nr:curli-like amyloid fiber formation chaperone CsgH [Alphaproteobacteria bacterium]
MSNPLFLAAAAALTLAGCTAAPPAEIAIAPPMAYANTPPPLQTVPWPAPPLEADSRPTPPPANALAARATSALPNGLDGEIRSPQRRSASCDIRVRPTRGGVEVTGVARPGYPMSGEYDFVITRSGASGSSDITQGGPFNGRAGDDISLSSTEISLGRRDRYRAVLTLTANGREICRREIRS